MNLCKLMLTMVIFIFLSLTLYASQLNQIFTNNTIKSAAYQTVVTASNKLNQNPTAISNDSTCSPHNNQCQDDNVKSTNINDEDSLSTYNYNPTPDIFRHGFDLFASQYDIKMHNNLLSNSQNINSYQPISQSGIINQNNMGNINCNLPIRQCFAACITDEESHLLSELAFNKNLPNTNIKLENYQNRDINKDIISKNISPIWIGDINFIISLIPDFPDINSKGVSLQIKKNNPKSCVYQDQTPPYNNYSAFYTITVLYNNNCKKMYEVNVSVNDYLSYNKGDIFNGVSTIKIKDLKNQNSIYGICSNRKMCVKSYSILNSSYDAANNLFARRDIKIDVRYSYFEDDYADLLLGCIK